MVKNNLDLAKRNVEKAEKLYKALQYKKAGKSYHTAANIFLELEEYQSAKESFIKSGNSYLELNKINTSLELYRLAGDVLIINRKYIEASDIFKKAIEFIPQLKPGTRDNYYILFSVLSYLCLLIKAKQDVGLDYLKKYQTKVEKSFFKESPLVKIVTEITLALRDKKLNYIERVKEQPSRYKLNEFESSLLKKALLTASAQILMKSHLTLDKEEYTTKDQIKLKLDLDINPIIELARTPFYQNEVADFKINLISIKLSDNLALSKKPDLPLAIPLDNNSQLNFLITPHFQLDNPYIGPIFLTCEINNEMLFIGETKSLNPKIISPPPSLEVSIKNLRPPLLDQTFPMEILIENKSQGEAGDVNIEVTVPEELKVMRGTTKKQIYSLRTNEGLKWEINLKPIEAGDYTISINLQFKDPDQNSIEDIKVFPFSIKL